MANKCGSYFGVNEISNSNNKAYAAKFVYQLEFINDTGLSIEVQDKQIGSVLIPANKTRVFKAHPLYPVEQINLIVNFNAAALPSDFLTIITTTSYGSNDEKCTS